MAKKGHLVGLDSPERSMLGQWCKGIDLTPAQKQIAADTIIAYRDQCPDIVDKVGSAIAKVLRSAPDPSSSESEEEVRIAVDRMLREI